MVPVLVVSWSKLSFSSAFTYQSRRIEGMEWCIWGRSHLSPLLLSQTVSDSKSGSGAKSSTLRVCVGRVLMMECDRRFQSWDALCEEKEKVERWRRVERRPALYGLKVLVHANDLE
jgi:hypothetical protein